MSLRCSVCKDPRIDAINLACVEGQGTQAIAKDFGISRSLIEHHRASGHPARALTKQVLDAQGGPLSEFATVTISTKLARVRKLAYLFERCEEEIKRQKIGELDPRLVTCAAGLLVSVAKEMGEWKPDGGEKVEATSKLAQSIIIHAASNAAGIPERRFPDPTIADVWASGC